RFSRDWSSDVCSSDLLSVCGVPIPIGSSEYSRLRGGIAAGTSVHSGKIASPSASMLASPPLPPDRELAGGRPVRLGEAARSYLRSEERRVGKECRWRW